ncbi:hypothetical protein FQN52_000987 [Onygenales sp. PD_12]|nr:hypothetical protein FQN53_002067 [Emmonsiellopsis sp. PD_33]KAK2782254.1 hypothetical protein FQN52_000987 [Onygenales sp. PD_12]
MAPSNYSDTPEKHGDTPPIYRIDLSLPPAQRYVELATIYRDQMRALTVLFDELVESTGLNISAKWVRRLAWLFLRGVYSREETEELRGMSRTTGIDLYLLVSLNVVLDLLMGCTSGGARCRTTNPNDGGEGSKMLHFRTLDWGMDGLRELIVQLEFVRSPKTEDVLATSITYVGYVGVLTGVRKNLSVSLNFRPNHNGSGLFSHLRFYGSHLLVLLGLRRSISSLLRQCILPPRAPSRSWLYAWLWPLHRAHIHHTLDLSLLATMLPNTPTTSAYLTLSDGNTTTILEKDHRTAITHSSRSFIVATNHDTAADSAPPHSPSGFLRPVTAGLSDLLQDSRERRACMQAFWDKKVELANKRKGIIVPGRRDPLRRTQSSRPVGIIIPSTASPASASASPETSSTTSHNHTQPPTETNGTISIEPEVTATESEIINMISTYPITNETTHFAAVMDPREGKVVWVQRYTEPVDGPLWR